MWTIDPGTAADLEPRLERAVEMLLRMETAGEAGTRKYQQALGYFEAMLLEYGLRMEREGAFAA